MSASKARVLLLIASSAFAFAACHSEMGAGGVPDGASGVESDAAGAADANLPADAWEGQRDSPTLRRDSALAVDSPALVSFTSCTQPGVYFCDDFESGAINPTYGQRHNGASKVTVDSVRAHGGKFSLHTIFSHDEAGIDVRPKFPAGPTKFFMRAYVYFTLPTNIYDIEMFWVFGTLPNVKDQIMVNVSSVDIPWGEPGGTRHAELNYVPNGDGLVVNDKIGLVPDSWSCWEWQVDGDKNEWRVWVDGVQQIEVLYAFYLKRFPVPNVDSMFIGLIGHTDEPAAMEYWFDDVVVSSERIGCPR